MRSAALPILLLLIAVVAPATPSAPPVPVLEIELDLDLAAPRFLLDMIDRGAATDEELGRWVALPGNRELMALGMPAEHLRANARAVVRGEASDYLQPLGHAGTVRMEPIDAWRRAIVHLEANADAIARQVSGHVAPFVPADVVLEPVTAYFHLGGGWDARTSDAIYVNLSRLLDTPQPDLDGIEALLARELIGLVQSATQTVMLDFRTTDSTLLSGMQYISSAGAARFVERRLLRSAYPEGTYAHERVRDYARADQRVAESMAYLDRFVGMAVVGRTVDAESLMVEGMRTGDFPAIGDLLSRTAFAGSGSRAIADCMSGGSVGLFRRYDQVAAGRGDLPDLPIALAERLDGLGGGLERAWLLAEPERRAAYAALDAGDYASALQPLLRLTELLPDDPIQTYNLACVLAMTGQPEQAIGKLELAVEYGFDDADHLRADPDLLGLHPLPGFQAILAGLEGGPGAGREDGVGAGEDEEAVGEGGLDVEGRTGRSPPADPSSPRDR